MYDSLQLHGCSLPSSSVHGILCARLLEWVAFPFSRGSSQPRIEPRVPTLQADADSLLSEPPEKDTVRRKQNPDYWDSKSSLEEVIFESIYLTSKEYCR